MQLKSVVLLFLGYLVLVIWGWFQIILLENHSITLVYVIASVFSVILMFKLGIQAFSPHWDAMDKSQYTTEWIRIPKRVFREDPFLWGCIYRAKDSELISKPYIIIAHGAQNILESMDWISIPIALNNFHVMAFNQSGHGKKPHSSPGDGYSYPNVMIDIHDVVEFVKKMPDCKQDSNNIPLIGFVGHSTGGLMALTQAFLNPDIKMCISMSSIHDFNETAARKNKVLTLQWWFKTMLKLIGMKIQYSEEENKIISPAQCLTPMNESNKQIFLIQAEDDVLPIEDQKKNQALGEIPDENCLYLKKGGHGFQDQELIVISRVITWLNSVFF